MGTEAAILLVCTHLKQKKGTAACIYRGCALLLKIHIFITLTSYLPVRAKIFQHLIRYIQFAPAGAQVDFGLVGTVEVGAATDL